jgi:hypothetical protein
VIGPSIQVTAKADYAAVTLADVASGELPVKVSRLVEKPGVWEPH